MVVSFTNSQTVALKQHMKGSDNLNVYQLEENLHVITQRLKLKTRIPPLLHSNFNGIYEMEGGNITI